MKKTALLFSLMLFFIFSNAQDEWTVIHPYPTSSNLLDACFVSEQEGWAVGTDGLIMHTTDGGYEWDIQHDQPQESFWGIFFVDELEGWAVGWSKIYHTDNGGISWEKQLFPSVLGDLTDVYFINPDTGWIVGTYKIVLLTTNGGENWTKVMNQINGEKCFYSVDFTDALHGCAVGGRMTYPDEGFIMVTDNGGLSWTETSPPDSHDFKKIRFSDSLSGWACGYDGDLYKTTDRGNTWEDRGFSYDYFRDIHFFDDSNGMLLAGHMVLLTTDGGEQWDSTVYIYGGSLSSFACSGENQGLAIGYGGEINKTYDGGYTWEGMNHGVLEPISQIGMFNAMDGLAINSYYPGGDLLVTTDGGHYWYPDTLVENGPFYKLFMKGLSCWLLNTNSQMMKTNNGQDWELLEVPSNVNQYRSMQFVDDNTGYISGYPGIVFKTTDGGHTWIDKSLQGEHYLWDMFFLNEDYGWLIDFTNKQIIRTNNGGDDWTITMLDNQGLYQPKSVCFTDENTGFVITEDGILFKTENGGDSWAPIFLFNLTANDIQFTTPTEGWCITNMSIQHTYDGGFSWSERESFGTNHISGTYFIDKDHGWLWGSNGLVATYEGTVGIQELQDKIKTVSVYPNPAFDEVTIENLDIETKITDIQMLNLQGQQVLHFPNLSELNTYTINSSGLTNGIYILQVSTKNGQNLIKFVKQ